MKRYARLLFVAGISLFALAACGEEQSAEQTAPQSGTEEQAPDSAGDETGEAMDQIREGAESLGEGAGQLFEEGREAADRALEDAGPALEKAGEAATEVGKAVDAIVKRAMSDFEAAVEALNERIEESDGGSEPVTGDPEAVLAPPDRLNEDTKAAARAGPAGVGPDYVGVWAAEAAECERIDQEATEIFAVITPTTIRRYENVCNFEAAEMTEGSANVTAECIAEGTTEDRRITFSMESPDALTIRTGDASGVDLVRCHLPR